jgi:hypothetical protein
MPRSIRLSVPSDETESWLERISQFSGVLSLRVTRGSSVVPPGDEISLEITNRDLPAFGRMLDEAGVGSRSDVYLVASDPLAVISSRSRETARDSSESTFEEMDSMVAKESNMTANALVVMAVAGIVAALGIQSNAIHVVVGAMVIAPGFEPIARIGLGIVGQSRVAWFGLGDTLKAFGVLILAAALTSLVLGLVGKPPLAGEATYLESGSLVRYWTQITFQSVLASLAAGVAGAIFIATNRSVLTAGVMIALALIPAASLVGMGIVAGRFDVAGQAGLRWLIDAGLVLATALAVFGVKQRALHRRAMMTQP